MAPLCRCRETRGLINPQWDKGPVDLMEIETAKLGHLLNRKSDLPLYRFLLKDGNRLNTCRLLEMSLAKAIITELI